MLFILLRCHMWGWAEVIRDALSPLPYARMISPSDPDSSFLLGLELIVPLTLDYMYLVLFWNLGFVASSLEQLSPHLLVQTAVVDSDLPQELPAKPGTNGMHLLLSQPVSRVLFCQDLWLCMMPVEEMWGLLRLNILCCWVLGVLKINLPLFQCFWLYK